MASSDVDQKYLGRVAYYTKENNPIVSEALYQILGLSVVLSRKLFRARKLRKLDTSRDTKSLQLYHHIIWLSREGLSILDVCILPYTQDGQEGPECQVLAAKLRASFVHIFCLFHNNPPITVASVSVMPTSFTPGPPSPRAEMAQSHAEAYESMTAQGGRITPPRRNSRGRQASLRDPIASITSDASFLTNPYAGLPPGSTPPPNQQATPSFPPGLAAVNVPQPSAFLLPSMNFVPLGRAHFAAASSAAAALLPGAHPLRLSTAIEHAAFLWDCVHDEEGARQLARRAIRQLREGEEEGVTDEGFEDAAEMVQILGRIMKRKSAESTPMTAQQELEERAASERASQRAQTASATAASYPSESPIRTRPQAPPTAPPTAPATAHASPKSRLAAGTSASGPLRGPRQYPNYAPPPTPPKTSELPTPPRQTPPRQSRQTPPQPSRQSQAPSSGASRSREERTPRGETTPREMRTSRDTQESRTPPHSPGIEGGPVGGITPPRPSRRGSTKTTSSGGTHRRATSSQTSPAAVRTPQRQSTTSSRRRTAEYRTPPGRVLDYDRPGQDSRETPPRPPPKDPGYTPSVRSAGKLTAPGSRRGSAGTGRRVEFAGNGHDGAGAMAYPSANGNGVHHENELNGYHDGGER